MKLSFLFHIRHKILYWILISLGNIILIKRLRFIFVHIYDYSKTTTFADLFLNFFIKLSIKLLYFSPGILSEEAINKKNISWIIDPLDGTRSFINNYKGYVIQVCRIKNKRVIQSIIIAPALREYYSYIEGDKPRLNGYILKFKDTNNRKIRIIDNYPEPVGITKYICNNLNNYEYIESGSISLKALYVAIGRADIFVKDVPIRDWDILPVMPFLMIRKIVILKLNQEKYDIDIVNFEKKGIIVSTKGNLTILKDIVNRYLKQK